MGNIGRQQKDVALANGLSLPLAGMVDVLQHYVSFQLLEQLITGVNVEVSTSIGTTNDHDNELGVLPDHLGPYRRLQQITVLIDPTFETQRCERRCHTISL